eukprot:5030856-Pleurochrysis_carterae.AAC.1
MPKIAHATRPVAQLVVEQWAIAKVLLSRLPVWTTCAPDLCLRGTTGTVRILCVSVVLRPHWLPPRLIVLPTL